MQMFELMVSSEPYVNRGSVKLFPKFNKFKHSILNRSRSNEPIINQKPPRFTRSNTLSNLPNTNLNEPKFENRLPNSFFKPKNIYPDLDDLINTLHKLKQKEVKKNYEPAPWQHSTFKNNPLHCNSSEFEDYDDKLKIENYKTYGDIDRNALKMNLDPRRSRKRLVIKTRRTKKKPKNKKRKRIRKIRKKGQKKKAEKNKSYLFDSFNEVKLKKVVKKNHSKLNTTKLTNSGKKSLGLFNCCYDRESQIKDYYLVIPKSEVGTFKPTMTKEKNFFIIQTNPEPKKSLKLYKKRKPIIGQNLFHNDLSRITAEKNLPNKPTAPDDFTSITKFNESLSKISVMKHIYKLYTSDTINFFDDKTYVISKSNGSTSTRRVRNFFMNTSPEYDNNAEFIPQFHCYGSMVESTKTNLPNRNRTKSLSHLNGLIHKFEDKIQDGNQNELKMNQGSNFLKGEEMATTKPSNETRNHKMCYRSKTLAPISRPISNNFALINSNLNEIENILKNPKPEQEFNIDLKKGLHDWSLWRSKFNETLIKSCFTPAKLIKSIQTHNDLRLKSQSYIEPSFVHYSSYYGDNTNLDPESFMFYGIPRARVNRKATLAEEESDQFTVEERLDSTESHKQTLIKKVTRSVSENRIAGSNSVDKVEIFDISPKKSIIRKYSVPDSGKFIETKHIYQQEPENYMKMMAMPTKESKEVLKAADGDIIFHRANQKIPKHEESPEKINCLGKSKQKADECKKKNYFNPLKNMLSSKSKTKKSKELEPNYSIDKNLKEENNTMRRRKRDHVRKSSIRLSKRKKPDIGKSRNGKRNQRSIRAKKRKSRNLNYQSFNPRNYQAYPTRKSPFFITNNTAQNIEYFTNHILDISYDISKFDKDIIDLSSSSSSTLSSKSTDNKFKSKIVRERTKRHFDRIKREKSVAGTLDSSDQNIKFKSSVNSKESPSASVAPPPPQIEKIPKRKSSQVSKLSIPMVQPPLPQMPPPSLSRFSDIKIGDATIETAKRNSNESKKKDLRRMKVTEQKIEFEKVEIIQQEFAQIEKLSDEKEKYPNLFKLPKLRYNPQMDTSILSTTTLSNARTRPKTSKEILQEISRLTNGTSINNKFNFTFQNNSSDFDTSIMSSNSRLIQK
ncbi:hypothetical protein BpHYR1_008498 [Brachionus plicatilis]|uniref:Uncharacterized protein n=1 Tax=Brachionus plicatilis TaxID=10195 RepID=A0A3M7T4V4_BRAPC|nr:hypothetical protein BpHYR1_008498 [Brachionus plicatilis]